MTTLLCLHHAGGAPTSFRGWRHASGPAIEVVPVAYPTTRRIAGRRIHSTTGALVEHLVDEYGDVLREPYVLYGHSMGGLLAYLLARRLQRSAAHVAPAALIVAASWSPRMRPTIDVDRLDDDALLAVLGQIGGIPADLLARPEWLLPMLPIVRDDLRMCSRYEHDPQDDAVDVPVHVIGATNDKLVTPEQTAGWTDLGEQVSIEYQPGGHFFDVDPIALQRRVFALATATSGEGKGGVRAVS